MTVSQGPLKVLHWHSCGKYVSPSSGLLLPTGDFVVAHKKTLSPEAKELTEFVHVIGCNWSVFAEMNCIVFFSRCGFVFLCCFQSGFTNITYIWTLIRNLIFFFWLLEETWMFRFRLSRNWHIIPKQSTKNGLRVPMWLNTRGWKCCISGHKGKMACKHFYE